MGAIVNLGLVGEGTSRAGGWVKEYCIQDERNIEAISPKRGPPVNEANCRKVNSDKEGGITDIPEGVIEVFGLIYNEATVLSTTEHKGSLKSA
jgi:hypothetical protein